MAENGEPSAAPLRQQDTAEEYAFQQVTNGHGESELQGSGDGEVPHGVDNQVLHAPPVVVDSQHGHHHQHHPQYDMAGGGPATSVAETSTASASKHEDHSHAVHSGPPPPTDVQQMYRQITVSTQDDGSATVPTSLPQPMVDSPSRQKRKRTSKLWAFFDLSDDRKHVKCRLCPTSLVYTNGTSSLKNHMMHKHPDQFTDLFGNDKLPPSKARKARQKTSPVWEYFVLVDENTRVRCTLCSQYLIYSNSTSNLKNHLNYKHRAEYEVAFGHSHANSRSHSPETSGQLATFAQPSSPAVRRSQANQQNSPLSISQRVLHQHHMSPGVDGGAPSAANVDAADYSTKSSASPALPEVWVRFAKSQDDVRVLAVRVPSDCMHVDHLRREIAACLDLQVPHHAVDLYPPQSSSPLRVGQQLTPNMNVDEALGCGQDEDHAIVVKLRESSTAEV